MLQQCCQLLEDRQLKIAFIESASSGYLTSQFSIHKNSGADILLGGLVSYDPSIKISILNIDPKLIETYTAESPQVTEEMCRLGQSLFQQADIIVSCTGLLKSGGSETPEKPVGTFLFAFLTNSIFIIIVIFIWSLRTKVKDINSESFRCHNCFTHINHKTDSP